MVCYEAAEKLKRGLPSMTRFREEHYATQAHRTWVKIQRADNAGREVSALSASSARCQERRTLRSEYFAKKGKSTKAPKARQRRLLDG